MGSSFRQSYEVVMVIGVITAIIAAFFVYQQIGLQQEAIETQSSFSSWEMVIRQNDFPGRSKLSALTYLLDKGENLEYINLNNIRLNQLTIGNGKFWGVLFQDSRISECKIINDTELTLANFRASKLRNVVFDKARLSAANFNYAELIRITFSKWTTCDLTDFSNSKLLITKFGLDDDSKEQSSKMNMEAAFFSNASLSKVDFIGVKLNTACFNNAFLDEVRFINCDLRSAKFVKVRKMHKVKFVNCDMRQAIFDGSDCVGAIFDSSKVMNVSFKDANLSKAKIITKGKDREWYKLASVQNANIADIVTTPKYSEWMIENGAICR